MMRYFILFLFFAIIASLVGVHFQEYHLEHNPVLYEEEYSNNHFEKTVASEQDESKISINIFDSIQDKWNDLKYSSDIDFTMYTNVGAGYLYVNVIPATKENLDDVIESIELDIDAQLIYNDFLENNYNLYQKDGLNIHVFKNKLKDFEIDSTNKFYMDGSIYKRNYFQINDNDDIATIILEPEIQTPKFKEINDQIKQKNFYIDKIITGGKKDLIVYHEIIGDLRMQISLILEGDNIDSIAITSNYFGHPTELTEDELAIVTKTCMLFGLTEADTNKVVAMLSDAPSNKSGKIGTFNYDIKTIKNSDYDTFKLSISLD